MSILFVLLMFLMVLTITHFRGRQETVPARVSPRPPRSQTKRELGFEIPASYCFHPAHTWAVREGRETARVGIDNFTANLLGEVNAIVVTGEQRWVRQGQKLLTLSSAGQTLDMLSPLEGVVTAVNPEVVKDPTLLTHDPYNQGWVCMIKCPEMETNLRNLVQGSMVAPWMQNNISRLNQFLPQPHSGLAQDGGTPRQGVLATLPPATRQKLIAELFLT